MVAPSFQKVIDDYRTAAHDAYQQVGEVVGLPLIRREDERRALQNMTEQELDALAEVYGVDQVVHYINRVMGG